MQSAAKKRRQSVPGFLLRYTLGSLTFVVCGTLMLSAIYGIHQDFIAKKAEIQKYAHLFADSAASKGHHEIRLSEYSLKHILEHDKVIQGIKFYDFTEKSEAEKTQQGSWITSLFSNSYVVNEKLYHHQRKNSQQFEDELSASYVSISIDLQELRSQWLKSHLLLFIFIPLLYIVMGTIIYLKSSKIRNQLITLQSITNGLISNDGVVSLPISRAHMSFIEYHDIKQGIVHLVNIYNESQEAISSLESKFQHQRKRDGAISGQRNKVQGMMVDEIGHSLNAINGGVQVLSNQYLSDDQHNAVATIRKGTQQLEFVLSQVAQLQKIEKGEMLVNQVEFNALQLLSDILSDFQTQKINENINLINNINHLDHMLEGDIDKIQRIVRALINNALKYTQKGQIKISSNLQYFDQTTRWTIKIKDTGIGIDEKDLNNIFLPFFQVDNDINRESYGIGVGLTLAKQMADLIGATLKVNSVPGHGSDFELIIPLLEKSQTIQSSYLKGISIVYFDTEQQYHHASELEHYGVSKLSTFHNVDEAMLYLTNQSTDVLLVASRKGSKSVNTMFTENYRLIEEHHRALVVWLNFDSVKNPMKEASMQAIGVDVCLEGGISSKHLAETIKDWLA